MFPEASRIASSALPIVCHRLWLPSWTDGALRDPTPGIHYDLMEEVRRTGAAVSAVGLLSLGSNVREAEAL